MSSQRHAIINRLITFNLIAQVLIIFTGGLVRLTGSGLGCSTWPNCEPGHFTPITYEATSYHPYVEWGNRVISAAVVVIAALLAYFVWRAVRDGNLKRSTSFITLAYTPLILVLVQALIGGITVRMELHPAIVGSHFLISATLVWLSAWLFWRWRESDSPAQPIAGTPGSVASIILLISTTIMVILGVIVTGSGPHSGDEEVGYRFAVDPLVMTRSHAISVWVFIAVLGALTFYLMKLHRSTPNPHLASALKRSYLAIAVTVLQGGIGYFQYFTGLPIGAVSLHLLGAALLIIAVAGVQASLRTRLMRDSHEPHGQHHVVAQN